MFQSLNDSDLLERTQNLVVEERKITQELIAHLREIERRMLFAELGYSSLFEFCTRHLKLSEGSAGRRIAAMRLVRDVPEAKKALESGELSLSNAAKIQSAFQAQKRISTPLLKAEKRELIAQMSGLTQRECEAKIFEALPQIAMTLESEKQRVVGPHHTELKLVVSQTFMEKLQRLQELNSHRVPDGSWVKLLEQVMTEEVARLEKKKGLQPSRLESKIIYTGAAHTGATHKEATHKEATHKEATHKEAAHKEAAHKEAAHKENHSAAERTEKLQSDSLPPEMHSVRGFPGSVPKESFSRVQREKIPARVVQEVWRRARGRCEMKSCRSRRFLEVDHVALVSQGGRNELENLRLLCR